jgi:DNA polymerase (family 10)
MPITNSDIAEELSTLADLLELQRAKQYRVRAYRNAARAVAGLPRSVADLLADGQDCLRCVASATI